MKTYFKDGFFKSNRRRLRQLIGTDTPLVITANSLSQRNGDMAHDFRQDSSFWYLTGINEPEVILVMEATEEYLIVPSRHHVRNIFDGKLDFRQLSARSGIKNVYESQAGWDKLINRLDNAETIATLMPPEEYVEAYEFYTNPARRILRNRLQAGLGKVNFIDIRDFMARLRMVKQPPELESLRDSINLTVDTFKAMITRLKDFKYEYEIEAYLSHAYRSQGARDGYGAIVGGGGNACVLHYESNQSELEPGQLVLIDSGAEIEFYSADISRTYSRGRPTKRQRQVFDAVKAVYDFALSNLKPGISIKDNEKLVENYMGEQLRSLGLIDKPTREKVRTYFPHATSHFLGLDVHDLGDYEQPLSANMVITVEPGIYIPAENIGIRIEDDILITQTGYENLSAGLPISLS